MYKQTILNKLNKEAGAFTDWAGNKLGKIISPILMHKLTKSNPATASTLGAYFAGDAIGSFKGMTDHADLDDLEKMVSNKSISLLPGVASYRNAAKSKIVEDLLSKKKRRSKHKSEVLGQYTSSGLLSLLGGGVGSHIAGDAVKDLVGDSNWFTRLLNTGGKLTGGTAGAAAGAGTGISANLLGFLLAQITSGRTKKDQEKYYNRSSLANYLIPGVAAYNRAKTLGLADRMGKELVKSKKSKK